VLTVQAEQAAVLFLFSGFIFTIRISSLIYPEENDIG
jgi:hypothetical protein